MSLVNRDSYICIRKRKMETDRKRAGSDGARPCELLVGSEGVVESMSLLQLLITAL